jgi:hypothetical protein
MQSDNNHDRDGDQDSAYQLAYDHIKELVDQLQGLGVDWGPNKPKAQIAVSRQRDRLVANIRARDQVRDRAVKQNILAVIRMRLGLME